jgi:hypothetical protein
MPAFGGGQYWTDVYVDWPEELPECVVVAPAELAHNEDNGGRVVFRPFSGIGQRRFIDLFSLVLGMGRANDRKADVTEGGWCRRSAQLRASMVPTSYLEREFAAVSALKSAKDDQP